jgi:hypothetical protein
MINDVVKVSKLDHNKNLKNKNYSNVFTVKMPNSNFKLPNIWSSIYLIYFPKVIIYEKRIII